LHDLSAILPSTELSSSVAKFIPFWSSEKVFVSKLIISFKIVSLQRASTISSFDPSVHL
jgi:hypothetical protein